MKSIAPYSRIREDALVGDIVFTHDETQIRKLLRAGDVIVGGNFSKSVLGRDETSSTLLFADDDDLVFHDTFLEVGSYMPLAELDSLTSKRGILNFNLLGSIPGRIGGALATNAEFLSESLYDSLISVEGIDEKGDKVVITRNEIQTDYRSSDLLQRLKVILRATFSPLYGSKEEIEARHKVSIAKRKTQPSINRTLGSTFKNPPGHKAFEAVRAVWTDFRSPAFRISEVHANFLDFAPYVKGSVIRRELLRLQEEIFQTTKIRLDFEIRFLNSL